MNSPDGLRPGDAPNKNGYPQAYTKWDKDYRPPEKPRPSRYALKHTNRRYTNPKRK